MRSVYAAVIVVACIASFVALAYVDVSYTGLFYSSYEAGPEWEMVAEVNVSRSEVSRLL